MHAVRCSTTASFSTTPRAPSCSASSTCRLSISPVSTMVRVCSALAVISRSASMPATLGIARSSSSTSGLQAARHLQRFHAVAGLAHHLDCRIGQQHVAQADAHHRMVVGDHYADWIVCHSIASRLSELIRLDCRFVRPEARLAPSRFRQFCAGSSRNAICYFFQHGIEAEIRSAFAASSSMAAPRATSERPAPGCCSSGSGPCALTFVDVTVSARSPAAGEATARRRPGSRGRAQRSRQGRPPSPAEAARRSRK